MSQKKKNTATTAEKSSKEESNEQAATVQAVPQEQTQESIPENRLPTLQELLKDVDPQKIKQADAFFPASALIQYMAVQEQKVNWLLENMPTEEKVKSAFIQVIEKQNQQIQANNQSSPSPQGSGGWGELKALAAQIIAGAATGGGGDSEFAALGKQLLEVQIQNMKAESDFTRSIKNAIVSKLVGGAVAGVI